MKKNAETSVIETLNALLEQAIEQRASDIHMESGKDGLRIRFRVDGVLYDKALLSAAIMPQIISRVKVLAHMDIAQRRVPQDGKFRILCNSKYIDLRVSTFPTVFGQKMVIRILETPEQAVSIESLGMSLDMQKIFKDLMGAPQGFFLVTGPTGSGKSTTLYAGLSHINSPDKNIITLEDPIEYYVEGITQGYIHPEAGFTFEKGMRALLRQDPDVVMVGEIRDEQTARIAVQAATTGHLVLSTLHTNDASSAIVRLMDMGIEPFLLNASITGVLAQRLVRKLCALCAQQYEITPAERAMCGEFATDMVTSFRPVGCDVCFHTGSKGRVGIFEFLVFNDALRSLISHNPSMSDLRAQAYKDGMTGLLQNGLAKVKAGEISLQELLRVVR